jgi:D-alanyl-D-alanine endopeptidase (penicillin-binding protein 7)
MNNSFLQKILFVVAILIVVFAGNKNIYSFKNDLQTTNSNSLKIKEEIPFVGWPFKNTKDEISISSLNSQLALNNNSSKEILESNLSTPNPFIFKYKSHNYFEPEISAEIALIADLKSEKIIWSKNENKRWPLASLTKLITAVYVLKNFDSKAQIEVKDKDFQNSGDLNLLPGEIYTVSDLIAWMLLPSNNTSAYVLANYKNYDKFMEGMNNLVLDWGVKSTFFKEPSGISVANQSTALDVLKIVKKIYEEYPEVLKITQSKSLNVKDLSKNKIKTIYNTHPFVGEKKFLGGKTGQTDFALQNLVSIFLIKQRPVLFLVMGSKDRTDDTQKILNWFNENFQVVEK